VPRILSPGLIWIFAFPRSHAGGSTAGRLEMEGEDLDLTKAELPHGRRLRAVA
jgi:hypothetical protein